MLRSGSFFASDRASASKENSHLAKFFGLGRVENKISLWIGNINREILCFQRTWKGEKQSGLWDHHLSDEIPPGKNYLDVAKNLFLKNFGLESEQKNLVLLHTRVNETADVFIQSLFYLWENLEEGVNMANPDYREWKWFSLMEISQFEKNHMFSTALDEQVMVYLQNLAKYAVARIKPKA